MTEEYLLAGTLEPTNEFYAIAKIAGVKLCQAYRRQYGSNFISAMPTNLYGPHDNFDLTASHVVPALIRKFHDAKLAGDREVSVWGTGRPRRELLHVDDLADACVFLMHHYDGESHINIGTGEDLRISEIAEMIRDVVYPGSQIIFDPTRPDGMPRKLLDVSRLQQLGWQPKITLRRGIDLTYQWFLANQETFRGRG
jgi:GDP-L-fucose synthase